MTLMRPMDLRRGGSVVQTIEHETTPEALWQEYWEDRSIDVRNRLVTYYAPLVTIVARRFAHRSRSMESLEELYSFGCFGLIDAVERWDSSEGFKFATYATRRIQGAILDELRREDFLPKRLRARVQIYNVTRDDLTARLHRTPTINEMAGELGVSQDDAIKLHDDASVLTYLAPLVTGSEASEGRMLGAASPDQSPADAAENAEMIEAVKAALRTLTERQRQVLVLHFLEGMTKAEIADALGVGRSRITQLMQQGLRNLQLELGLDVAKDGAVTAPDGGAGPGDAGDSGAAGDPVAGGRGRPSGDQVT
jgi:RNA polymerase sigma factor FliA